MLYKSKIIFTFCLSIVILISIGIYTFKSINDYKDSSTDVHHSQQVITSTQKTLTDIQIIESLQRGYLITGDKNCCFASFFIKIDADGHINLAFIGHFGFC